MRLARGGIGGWMSFNIIANTRIGAPKQILNMNLKLNKTQKNLIANSYI